MTKREIVKRVLEGGKPPYVPWACSFTLEAEAALRAHFAGRDLEDALQNHIVGLGSDIGFFEDLADDRVRDVFGVVWDRSVDKDIGIVEGCVLPEPTLDSYRFPDPLNRRFFEDIPGKIARYGDRFRVFRIGFSLYERAWSMRGMETLMMDFYDSPDFVRALLRAIADYNLAQIDEALKSDIDAVYFGDDWGSQRGLQMSPKLWRQYLLPELRRMYGRVRDAGKFVMIHSCGDVDELFDDLIDAGVNCFNPFQPEVMDVHALLDEYHGRLCFHGGLSTQRTLPYGTANDVRNESRRLIEHGREGGYVFSPAHSVEGDVPLENMLAFLEALQSQPGAPRAG
ncbi:MAG TPA: uroporphyrinogen decarboxylase family protein [Armatimonadota bacterium]